MWVSLYIYTYIFIHNLYVINIYPYLSNRFVCVYMYIYTLISYCVSMYNCTHIYSYRYRYGYGYWYVYFNSPCRLAAGMSENFRWAKITADGDCSHEIKRCLLLGRKVMTNLDSILKSRDITLPTKVHLVKAMVFPVVMYGCESWTLKKAENWRIDAFELWCWRRLLRAPWTARRSSQSILKEISPGCSLEGQML